MIDATIETIVSLGICKIGRIVGILSDQDFGVAEYTYLLYRIIREEIIGVSSSCTVSGLDLK